MSKPTHIRVVRRRQHRREKLWKLRRAYAAASSEAERQRIFERACKIAPGLSREQFVAPLQARGLL
jgi:hypothetical protein